MPELNWLAIIVAAVVMVVVSTAYYIIFGSQLKALSAAYADAQSRPPPWKVVLELARCLVLGAVVAGLISLLGISEVGGAIQLALALWVAFPVVLLVGSVQWDKVPPMLAAIHAGDWVLKLLIVTLIVTLWP